MSKKFQNSSNLNPKSRKTTKNLETTIQTRKWGQRKGAIKMMISHPFVPNPKFNIKYKIPKL
jgi:hypothetical protein